MFFFLQTKFKVWYIRNQKKIDEQLRILHLVQIWLEKKSGTKFILTLIKLMYEAHTMQI